MNDCGKWLYDSLTEEASTFRICDKCAAVYRIVAGDDKYLYCPKCGDRKEVSD